MHAYGLTYIILGGGGGGGGGDPSAPPLYATLQLVKQGNHNLFSISPDKQSDSNLACRNKPCTDLLNEQSRMSLPLL